MKKIFNLIQNIFIIYSLPVILYTYILNQNRIRFLESKILILWDSLSIFEFESTESKFFYADDSILIQNQNVLILGSKSKQRNQNILTWIRIVNEHFRIDFVRHSMKYGDCWNSNSGQTFYKFLYCAFKMY